MSKAFDPYYKWLGIASREQPPNHYRLLGIEPFEFDPDVITSAADMRMAHLRTFQSGKHAAESQKLLNEVATARVCLLDPRKKAHYDHKLNLEAQPKVVPPQPISTAQVEAEGVRAAKRSTPKAERDPARLAFSLLPPLPSQRRKATRSGSSVPAVDHAGETVSPEQSRGNAVTALRGGVLAVPRAIDGGLRRVAGKDNRVLLGFLRVVTGAAVVMLVALGLWRGGGSEADPASEQRAGTDSSGDLDATPTFVVSEEIDLPPPSGTGKLVSIGPRSYEVHEIRVNDHTSKKQDYPSLAVLTNNNFIVGWRSWHQKSLTDCYGKLFSADGTALGNEFLLHPHNFRGWEYGAALAAQPDGGFVVAWGASSNETRMQRFDGAMKPIGKDWSPMPESWPALSSAPNGDFVVVGTTRRNGVHDISARRYSPQGEPLCDTWQVNSQPLGFKKENISGATIAHDSDGSFTIAWYNAAGDILARRYDANGADRAPEFVANSSTGDQRMDTAIAYDSRGELLVAWYQFDVGQPHSIRARRFGVDGSPKGEEWIVAPGPANCPNLAIGPTNEVVIAWRHRGGEEIHARLYDAAGHTVGEPFQVNQHTPGKQYTAFRAGKKGIAIIGNMLVFTWDGNAPGDNEGVGMTTFRRVSSAPTRATATVEEFVGSWTYSRKGSDFSAQVDARENGVVLWEDNKGWKGTKYWSRIGANAYLISNERGVQGTKGWHIMHLPIVDGVAFADDWHGGPKSCTFRRTKAVPKAPDVGKSQAKIVAVWSHSVDRRAGKPLTLYSNGKINLPDSDATWSRNGRELLLRWPQRGAPGGAWIDRCTISADGRSYSGRNQDDVLITGKLVRDASASAVEAIAPAAPAPRRPRVDSRPKPSPKRDARGDRQQPPIVISVPGVSWLPLETGTGFFGGTSYSTPAFDVHYENKGYRGKKVRVVRAMNLQDEDGQVRFSMHRDEDLAGTRGKFRAVWTDPTGQRTLSGQGELEVYFAEPSDGDEKVISNIVRIPIAADAASRKRFEAKNRPTPAPQADGDWKTDLTKFAGAVAEIVKNTPILGERDLMNRFREKIVFTGHDGNPIYVIDDTPSEPLQSKLAKTFHGATVRWTGKVTIPTTADIYGLGTAPARDP
jgi:hypothetical protein